MPTKRARLVPRRINRETPEWAAHYLEAGEVPNERTDPEAWLAYLDWSVFREPVVGLPPARSPEGAGLLARERR